jgi:hypothetical protein
MIGRPGDGARFDGENGAATIRIDLPELQSTNAGAVYLGVALRVRGHPPGVPRV